MQNLFISLRKSFLQQISNNQISFFRRNPFDNQTKQPKLKTLFYSYPYSNNLISFKTALLQTNLKQPNQTIQVKNLFFYHYPYSNNLIFFKMTFIGLI
ncbi:hypothetical protein, partial [Helicobacter pylori]|uniref:hypothetical protein n=1 Tax=Helicobacter pylori TaxID=210 RepID=UPI0011B284C2